MKIARREDIRHYVEAKGEVTLLELQEMFPDCSMMTLRRDLIHLEEQGIVKRTRGGAVSIDRLGGYIDGRYSQRVMDHTASKMDIARKAVELIDLSCSLYIDSGSTTMFFAKQLPDLHCSVLTSGVNTALELTKNPKYSVTLLGGHLNHNTLSCGGAQALAYLDTVNIDTAVMATSGFSLDYGFTSGSYTDCEVKRAVISRARRTIMLVDNSKIGRSLPTTFAQLSDIEILVTDVQPPEDIVKACEEAGVQLVI
jgi:DeoR family fructose operon transcriptional repressor